MGYKKSTRVQKYLIIEGGVVKSVEDDRLDMSTLWSLDLKELSVKLERALLDKEAADIY